MSNRRKDLSPAERREITELLKIEPDVKKVARRAKRSTSTVYKIIRADAKRTHQDDVSATAARARNLKDLVGNNGNARSLVEKWYYEIKHTHEETTLANLLQQLGDGVNPVFLEQLVNIEGPSVCPTDVLYEPELPELHSLCDQISIVFRAEKDPLFPLVQELLQSSIVFNLQERWGTLFLKFNHDLRLWFGRLNLFMLGYFKARIPKPTNPHRDNSSGSEFAKVVVMASTVLACDLLAADLRSRSDWVSKTKIFDLKSLRDSQAIQLVNLIPDMRIELESPLYEVRLLQSTRHYPYLQDYFAGVFIADSLLDTCEAMKVAGDSLLEQLAQHLRDWR